ncbi:type II toxin-antitoxin system HicB family antitoxin [Candidatus Dependentiae bacterium]|nr:type II toxin-antitoxin system HicB family antitoxin [Candidatus Dependentiae bacterium]
MKNKNLSYYLNLPWTYTIETDIDENKNKIYIVSVNELEGVRTDGITIEQAIHHIKDAIESTIKLYMKHNEEIPEPIDEEQFKGNIAYRTSSRRHYLLAREAKKRDQSLSKIIDEFIDKAMSK